MTKFVPQGYAADFLPWLLPLHSRHLSQLSGWSHKIRDFMTEFIVQDRLDSWERASVPEHDQDYVDELIGHVRGNAEPAITWDTAMFALEDIVGGHSAVGNLLVKVSGGGGSPGTLSPPLRCRRRGRRRGRRPTPVVEIPSIR